MENKRHDQPEPHDWQVLEARWQHLCFMHRSHHCLNREQFRQPTRREYAGASIIAGDHADAPSIIRKNIAVVWVFSFDSV